MPQSAVIPLIPCAEYDFSDVSAGATKTWIMHRALDLSQWTGGQIVWRLHAKDCAGSWGIFRVRVEAAAPSPEDPAVDFVSPTEVSLAAFYSQATPPYLITCPLAFPPGFVRVLLSGTQPDPKLDPLKATVSADLYVVEGRGG